jgi:hypothetical protein
MPVLPTYNQHACYRFERPSDQEFNVKVFIAVLRRFCAALRECPKLSSVEVNYPFSPTDGYHKDGYQQYRDKFREFCVDVEFDLWERRYAHSYLSIESSSNVPLLDSFAV